MDLAEESERRSLSIAGTKGLIERAGFSPQVLIHVPGKLPCTSNVSSGSMHARFHGRSSSREKLGTASMFSDVVRVISSCSRRERTSLPYPSMQKMPGLECKRLPQAV